jgi:hypothetical protein
VEREQRVNVHLSKALLWMFCGLLEKEYDTSSLDEWTWTLHIKWLIQLVNILVGAANNDETIVGLVRIL